MNSAMGYSEGSDMYLSNPLIQEKEEIERKIKSFEEQIELAKTAIYWQKKRLRLVEQELNSNVSQTKRAEQVNDNQNGNNKD
jgi:hypothetical protein